MQHQLSSSFADRVKCDKIINLPHLMRPTDQSRGQDPYLWDNRNNAIKELAKELAKVVVQKGPVAANQTMLQQIQELQAKERQVRRTRRSHIRNTGTDLHNTHLHRKACTLKGIITPKTASTPKAWGAHPTPPSYQWKATALRTLQN